MATIQKGELIPMTNSTARVSSNQGEIAYTIMQPHQSRGAIEEGEPLQLEPVAEGDDDDRADDTAKAEHGAQPAQSRSPNLKNVFREDWSEHEDSASEEGDEGGGHQHPEEESIAAEVASGLDDIGRERDR